MHPEQRHEQTGMFIRGQGQVSPSMQQDLPVHLPLGGVRLRGPCEQARIIGLHRLGLHQGNVLHQGCKSL